MPGFSKPDLKTVAPTQSEPPFVVAQVVAPMMFVAFGVAATIKLHPAVPAQRLR
jgi:hypothetical protein